jgi:two-component system response regulator MprA
MNPSLLIVEDDAPLQQFLEEFLKEEGYIVQAVSLGSQALEVIKQQHPDLVILDLGLPDMQGEDVLRILRKDQPHLSVIILTAKSKVPDIAAGLNLGADDYLAKPFAAEELLARIHARLRQKQPEQETFQISDLTVNLNTREVFQKKRRVALTKTEFELLIYLMKNPGRVLTRDMILNHVWGYPQEIETRVVDVYMGYLRKKLSSFSKLLVNVRGVGYMFRPG